MRKLVLLLSFVLLCTLLCRAESGSVTGVWHGMRTTPSGAVYSAEMTLEYGPGCKTCAVISEAGIHGKIVWTLRKAGTGTPEATAAVDATATELVKGEMKCDGLLVLAGYQKDDPKNIIMLDKYRLALSEDGKVLGGITLNGGNWAGQFIAMRERPKAPQ